MLRFQFQKFFNTPGDAGGGAGTITQPPSTTTPSGGAASPSTVPGAGAGAGAGGGAGAGAGGAGTTGAEDRTNWIPPYRLTELTTQHQQQTRQMQGQLQLMEQRVRALMGLEPQANPEHTKLQEALIQVFPELAMLRGRGAEGIKKLLEMAESGQLETSADAGNQVWKRHAMEMGRSFLGMYAKAIGKEPKDLGQGAIGRLSRELRAFVEADRTGERLSRYESGDPTLLEEALTDLTGFYVRPAQVQQTTTAAGQVARSRQLPSSGGGATVPPAGGGAPATFANKKERFAAMRQALLASQ